MVVFVRRRFDCLLCLTCFGVSDEAKVLEHRPKVSGMFDDRGEGEHHSETNPGNLLRKLRRFHSKHAFMYYVHFVECMSS
jgi:hypothetical protein